MKKYPLRKSFTLIIFTINLFVVFSQSNYEKEYKDRCTILIDEIADYYPKWNKGQRPIGYDGKVSDFGKYNYPKIIALFTKYGINAKESEIANQRLLIYKDKPTFHFNLVGLPRILFLFPDAPGIKNNEIDFLKRVFERTDSYNAWDCEGTENHIGMSRTSGYLYAQLALEKYPNQFPDAKKRLKEMKEWMKYVSKKMYEVGTGEWNSSIYGAYNIIGWLNVYDFATDKQVKNIAKAVLDYYACELAINYSYGMIGGADLRGKGNTHVLNGSFAYLGWLWFGDCVKLVSKHNLESESKDNEHIQTIHAATSTYRVPELLIEIAQKKSNEKTMYFNSKPSYLLDIPSYIKHTLYVEKNYTLGAAYLPYGGWGGGDYQIVPWKLIARVDPDSNATPLYISGIGMQEPQKGYTGNMRIPFDQLIHHKNVLIQLTKVPVNSQEIKDSIKKIFDIWRIKWKEDFKSRFPDEKHKDNTVGFQDLDVSKNQSSILFTNTGKWNFIFKDSILFIDFDKIFVAIRSINGNQPQGLFNIGEEYKYTKVTTEKGKLCGLILEAGDKSEYKDFEDFQQSILLKSKLINNEIQQNKVTYITSLGDKIEAIYSDTGTFTEPIYDWGFGPKKSMVIQKSPPFIQPVWPTGIGHSKIAKWTINDIEIKLNKPWPVYSSEYLKIENGKLFINKEKTSYYVNYKKNRPVFKYRIK